MSCRGMTRRGFLLGTGAANLALPLAASPEAASRSARFTEPSATPPNQGAQRLSLARLQAWESLGYGMFLHFGISTFTGHEWDDGKSPASAYDPDRLDVDQWIQVARDAGMKYAVLCTKHVAGACLWPSRQTGYTVANSGRQTDVVEAFVKACERRGIRPGLYYCSFDNHHSFGSVTVDHCGLPYNTVEQVTISSETVRPIRLRFFRTSKPPRSANSYNSVVRSPRCGLMSRACWRAVTELFFTGTSARSNPIAWS